MIFFIFTQHVVDMLNSHVAKIEALVNLMKSDAKSEETIAKNNAAMGIEIVIRYVPLPPCRLLTVKP